MLSLTPAQKHALAAVALVALAAGGLRLTAVLSARGAAEVVYEPPAAPGELQVHVVGAVARPGLYRLALGSRVQDAVNAAGGFTSNALPESLNLAAFLDDGQQIVVEAVPEPEVAAPAPAPTTPEPPPQAHLVGAGAAIPPPAPAPPTASASTPPTEGQLPLGPAEGTAPPVCINTAGLEELKGLPGIGDQLAMRIIYYRDLHGPFRRHEDLLEVPGIGRETVEKLRSCTTLH